MGPGVPANKGPNYHITDVKGCSKSEVFGVVGSNEDPLFSDLLLSRHFLYEQSPGRTVSFRLTIGTENYLDSWPGVG